MAYWGKVLGGVAGLVMGGPLGAVMGAALGHAADEGGLAKMRAMLPTASLLGPARMAALQAEFDMAVRLETAFWDMGWRVSAR